MNKIQLIHEITTTFIMVYGLTPKQAQQKFVDYRAQGKTVKQIHKMCEKLLTA
jgi:ketopantoate hydroxymethyltransferase